MKGLILTLVLALCAGRLAAMEKASPVQQHGRQTSSVSEISLKPLFIYSSRGRRDPFTFDDSFSLKAPSGYVDFHISELHLIGFIGQGSAVSAVFSSQVRHDTFKFVKGQLYTPRNVPMPDVSGSILPMRQVVLVQGEQKIIYKLATYPALESLNATIANERKELQP